MTTRNSRFNRVVMLAVLVEKGPITNASGKATMELFDLMRLNGCTISTGRGLQDIFTGEFADYIVRDMGPNVGSKRTYGIELESIPDEYVDEVEALIPTLIWEAPAEPETPEIVPAESLVPTTTDPTPAPVAQPDAAEIAWAMLELVAEKIIAKPEPTDDQLRHRLGEAWDQLRAAKARITDLEDKLDRATKLNATQTTQITRLRAEVAQLDHNMKAKVVSEGSAIHEARTQAIGTIMGAPRSGKGD